MIDNENTLRFTRDQVRGYAHALLKLAWAVRRMKPEWFAQHAAVCGGANAGERAFTARDAT